MKVRLALAFVLVTLVAAVFPTIAAAGMNDGHDMLGISLPSF